MSTDLSTEQQTEMPTPLVHSNSLNLPNSSEPLDSLEYPDSEYSLDSSASAYSLESPESSPVDVKFLAELDQLNALLEAPNLNSNQRWNGLLSIAYGRLYRIANRLVGIPNGTPTLGATALVNEGYSRLMKSSDLNNIQDARHFYRRFAISMKHALTDNARNKLAEKRGGGRLRLDFDVILQSFDLSSEQLLELNMAIDELKQVDQRAGELIELFHFGLMSVPDLVHVTEFSKSTIERALRFGRAYLRANLREDWE